MINVQPENTSSPFNRFEVQPQAEDLFIPVEGKPDEGFAIAKFETDLIFIYWEIGIYHTIDGIKLRFETERAGQIELLWLTCF
jgi:hypothetical protein